MTLQPINFPIDQNVTVTTSATSGTFVPPSDPDRAMNRGLLLVSIAGPVTGTSPQLTYQVQGSNDGVNWFNIASLLTFTALGNQLVEFSTLLSFYQVVKTASGTSPSFGATTSTLVMIR